jgi:predicted nucleic acid-binding protein
VTTFLDSSVLVAALVESEVHHHECHALVTLGGHGVLAHALSETFSTLTSGRTFTRVPPDVAAAAIAGCARDYLTVVYLEASAVLQALEECAPRGVRGGAVHDFMHLRAAALHNAAKLYTLNTRHFLAFRRPGDSEFLHP